MYMYVALLNFVIVFQCTTEDADKQIPPFKYALLYMHINPCTCTVYLHMYMYTVHVYTCICDILQADIPRAQTASEA